MKFCFILQVSTLSMSLRCRLLPPFLHTFIGCDSNLTNLDASSNSSEVLLAPSARYLTSEPIAASSRNYGQEGDEMVPPSHMILEKTSFASPNTTQSTVLQSTSSPSHPHPPPFSSSLSPITPQEKNDTVSKSLRLERREKESLTGDEEIEGYAVAPKQHPSMIKESNTVKDKENAKEKDGGMAVNSDIMLVPQTSPSISHGAEDQTLLSFSDIIHDMTEENPPEHKATPRSIVQPSLPTSAEDSVVQDAGGITDEVEEKKDDTKDEDLNNTHKCGCRTRKETHGGEGTEDMTGSDPDSRAAKSGSSSTNSGGFEKWNSPKVKGIGLYVPISPESIHPLLAPLFSETNQDTDR